MMAKVLRRATCLSGMSGGLGCGRAVPCSEQDRKRAIVSRVKQRQLQTFSSAMRYLDVDLLKEALRESFSSLVTTWLWYLFLATVGLAILESFRALVEEWVLHTHSGADDPLAAHDDVKQQAPDGLTMQQVRAQRNAYRRALAGGLGASLARAPQAPSPEPGAVKGPATAD